MAKKKWTIGYVRISHKRGEQDGISLERQQSHIEQYCKLKEISNLRILKDAGISGYKKSNRCGFKTLEKICIQGKVERVIVYDLSRLSRSVRDTLEFVDDVIAKKDIGFVSLQQDINTETPMGRAFLVISSVFNQLYRDEIAYKMKLAWNHKKNKKLKGPGHLPYGFKSENGKLIPNEKEQGVVGLMRNLRANGSTLADIAKELNDKSIPTRRNKGGLETKHSQRDSSIQQPK